MLGVMATSPMTSPELWQVPRLRREQRWLAGVAAATAVELGVDALLVRLSFVLLTLSSGAGLALYAAAWLWFTYHERTHPGRVYVPVPKASTPTRRYIGLAAVVAGLVLLAGRLVPLGVEPVVLWPVALAAFGTLLAWSSGTVDWSAPQELARAVLGLLLVAVGVIAFIALNFGLAQAPRALLVATAVLAGLIVIVAPWLWRAASQLGAERLERIRANARAELAAHLHDSVLQTLSLIQQNAHDRATTVNLARRQERELRQWLFGAGTSEPSERQLRAALTDLASEVEGLHRVPIEVVVVGDAPLDAGTAPLLAATREALVNASKHSGAARVDVYAELGKGTLEVFVRDQGKGFDPSLVPADRRGLHSSVLGRMRRAGGQASVVSEPGRGTEIALELPRPEAR